MKRFVILTLVLLLAAGSMPAAAEKEASAKDAASVEMVQDKAMDAIDGQIAAAQVDRDPGMPIRNGRRA